MSFDCFFRKDSYLVGVGMMLFGKFEVRLFDGSLIGAFGNTQGFVKVSFVIGREASRRKARFLAKGGGE